MEEEGDKALEKAINSAYLILAYKIIKVAIRDKDQAFFCSEGFLWLLMVIGCEPRNLERIKVAILANLAGGGHGTDGGTDPSSSS